MAALLELENGDLENLQGRVIIYARCLNDVGAVGSGTASPGEVVAMFFTTDPADFTEKFGVPEGGLDDLARRAEEVRARNPDAPVGVVPIYGAPVDLEPLDIPLAAEDIVYAGNFTDNERCQTAVQIAAHLYMMHYSEQLVAESGVPSSHVEAAEVRALDPVAAAEPEKSYRDVPESEMSAYLQMRYIAPIMHAIEDDDRAAATATAESLIRFCGPSGPLTADAYALAAAVQSRPHEMRTALLYSYFEKILAIASQRFEDAARLRDEIKALRATMKL